ncbi:hypothetical protein [Macrococcus equi]|uniref:hypothetical protein n=1 Tax=Macrococcus equi TaxID=3395462 RepID=UPI0039BDB6F8
MKKSIRILITLTSLSLILSGCSEADKQNTGASKIVSSNNGEKESPTSSKQNENENKNETSSQDGNNTKTSHQTNTNITKVNGIAHYKYPKIDTFEYGKHILSNEFNIMGYHAGDDAGDLIDKLGRVREVTEDEFLGTNYAYDNFEVAVKDGKIFRILLNTRNLDLDPYLEKIWRVKSENTMSEYMRFDGNKNNGYYVEVYPEMGPTVGINSIAIIGENFKSNIPESTEEFVQNSDIKDTNVEMRDGIAYYNFPDIKNFDFAYEVCTAAFEINGIGLADSNVDFTPLGDYTDNNGNREYGNFGFEMLGDSVYGIKMVVGDQHVHIDDLIKGWKSKVDVRKKNSIFYDNDKTNGFVVRVDFDDEGTVQEIHLLGVNI